MRVLILGNSHAATLRLGFDAIRAAYPGVDLSFWGLPGAAFAKARVGANGLLAPDPSDAMSLRKAASWNEVEAINLARFDRIFLVGLRHGFRPALQLMRRMQPYDWGQRKGALGVSEGFLRAAVRGLIDASLAEQAARTPFDARFVAMPAPFPASIVTREGALYEPVTTVVSQLPQAADLMALYQAEIAAAHAALGLSFAPQPPETISAPFLSADGWLEDPARDWRHMNEHYGFAAFAALMAHPAQPLKETDHAMGS